MKFASNEGIEKHQKKKKIFYISAFVSTFYPESCFHRNNIFSTFVCFQMFIVSFSSSTLSLVLLLLIVLLVNNKNGKAVLDRCTSGRLKRSASNNKELQATYYPSISCILLAIAYNPLPLPLSVTRFGDLLDFGQVFLVFGNNYFAKNLLHS